MNERVSWIRVGGCAGIVFFISLVLLILLMPLTHTVPEPAFDAPSGAQLAYARSERVLPYALDLVGILGLFSFIVFATVLASRFGSDDRSNVAATLVRLATIVFALMWLALLAIRFAEEFRRDDLDTTGASVLSGLGSGFFVTSWAAIGGYLVASGIASLSSRAFPWWLGWSALLIGIAMLLSVAVPLTALWLLPYGLFFLWVMVTSALLIRSKP
jgi:hypothetical protein